MKATEQICMDQPGCSLFLWIISCALIFKKRCSSASSEPIHDNLFISSCLLTHHSSCIWSHPPSCCCGCRQGRGDRRGTFLCKRGGSQEEIHINLEEVTTFSYLSGSSVFIRRSPYNRVVLISSLLRFFYSFHELLVIILYDRCQQRNILDKAKIPLLYYAQINIFVNTAAIWRWEGEAVVLHKPGIGGIKSQIKKVSSNKISVRSNNYHRLPPSAFCIPEQCCILHQLNEE